MLSRSTPRKVASWEFANRITPDSETVAAPSPMLSTMTR